MEEKENIIQEENNEQVTAEKEQVEQTENNENKENKKEKKKKIDKEKDELIKANLELKEKVLRITAEMQNMKRRYETDISNLYKYDGFDLVTKILPVIDNFERAMNIKVDGSEKYTTGFKMIYDNLIDILKSYDIKEIDVLDKTFDPNIMNAVLTEENKDKDNNVVLEVLQKGYMYKDRLIRPAMVKVNDKGDT